MPNDYVGIIVSAAREIAEPRHLKLIDELGPEVPLFGPQGIFDSLGLVTLVVAVEEAIAERHGRGISLADERALSQTQSPFRTIGTLADYARSLLDETNA